MALGIVLAGWWSDYSSPRKVLIWGCIGTILVGLIFGPAMGSGSVTAIFLILSLALFAMGFVYGPLGAWLTALFPTQLRYPGRSEERRVGTTGVHSCRAWWSPSHKKTKE